MANTKISALPAATTPLAGTEVLPIVQSSTTDQVSVANLTAGRAVATGALTVTGAATISSTLGVAGATSLFSLATTTGTVATAPSGSTDIANKAYVDTVAQGLDTKASVVAGTTVNITLSGTQTIDGVVLIAGDRVLVKNQTAPADNGLYLCAAGSWTRTTDMDTWAEVPGAYVFVEGGSTLADTGWVCTSDAGGTIGVTAITWAQFSGAGSGVSSITFGSTGLTPATTTTGAVTVAGTLANTNGGTGQSSAFTQYGITYASSTTVLATTAAGTTTTVLHGNAAGAPTFGAVSLTADISGILGAANGGTGVANNAAMTVTGSGNFAYTRTLTATTNVTFPTTGTLSTLAGTETFTNKTLTNPTVTNYVESVVAIGNSGTTQTLSLTSGTVQTVTMTGNCTFTMPTATAGKSFILICTQDGTGGRTATFTSVKFPGGVAPTLTTTATTGVDILTFVANGTSWFGTYAQAFS